MIIAILVVLTLCAAAYFIVDDRRSDRAQRQYFETLKAESDRTWQQYREWCDSRVCLGGCGKKASERPRDANGVCTEMWVTEECCMECWRAGRSTGRSAESREWTMRFSGG